MKLHSLFETYDKPAKFKWVTDTNSKKVAVATIGKEEFIATFVPLGLIHNDMPDKETKSWLMSFVPKSDKADYLTGAGSAQQFVSTLYQILDDAFTSKHIDGIYIEARPEKSRLRTFDRLLKRLATKHKLKLYDEGEDFKHFWWYAK